MSIKLQVRRLATTVTKRFLYERGRERATFSVRATFLLLTGVFLGGCGSTPAASAPTSLPAIDVLMGCPTSDAVLMDFPTSAIDGARTLPVPSVLRNSLLYIPFPLSVAKPCEGIDPKYVVADRDNGNMRWALFGKVVKPLPVWRAFSANSRVCEQKPYEARLQGSWWSLEDPRRYGKDGYRKGAAVCSIWNDLGKVVHCTVKRGAIVAVGPTQSVKECKCPAPPEVSVESYGPTDQWQVYVNLYDKKMSDIMDCEAAVDW